MMKMFKQLIRSEKGSVIPLVAVTTLALVGATGTAIDLGRAQLVQSKLSSSLDAAGLAASSTINTDNLNTEVTKYMNANFNNFMGATITELNATPTNNNSVVELDATATLPTSFMQAFGYDTMTVHAEAEITRTSKGLELVMVLDNTGSMNCPVTGTCSNSNVEASNAKIKALRSAATSLVNILYGNNATVDDLYIGLVPFSQAVNIGTGRSSWTTTGSQNWGTTSWGGCVDARETSNRDTTDDPPSVATFPKYYWTCSSSNNPWYGNDTDNSRDNCGTSNNGYFGYQSGLGNTLGPNKSCPQPLTAMTGTKATILSAITAMQARGNTHIVLGAAWGWRMLSPRWRDLWGGDMDTHDLPLDYNAPQMNKAVIIMTDGDNTIDSNNKGGYGYLSEGRLGTTNQSTAESRLDSRLGTVCTRMKNNNIIVYTVSFGSISTSSQTMLRNCATAPEYYFNSPSDAALATAFQAIGDSLSNLRISK